jgi:hypothetical protein
MRHELIVHELFRLAGGITILACEGDASTESLTGHTASLVADGIIRQEILLVGERLMLNQTANQRQRAVETLDSLDLSPEEARSGRWRLILDA